MLKTLLIVGVMLIVTGILGTMYAWRMQSAEGSLEEVVLEPVYSLSVSAHNAQIDVISSSDDTTRITYSGLAESALHDQFSFELIDDHLKIVIHSPSRQVFFNFGFLTPTPKLTIALPKTDLTKINGTTRNGRIVIKDQSVEALDLKTSNGSVTLDRTETNDSRIKTSNGSITLQDTSGKIHAETNNGSIKAFNLVMNRDISLSTSNGSISVTLDKDAHTIIDADTRNGSITLFGNKTSHLTYGEGTTLLQLRTNNGSIKVEASR